ncbi:hypothetical protein HPB48_001796 [Haemaphysalis longicornis]|uniref:Serine/threonine-protein phosphatase 4 regulatory subunit 2 n=1 Tax=Haemaphysalis longicornis TaxID=44386 RepID=A0A9J6G4R4_HAELO|nr:hypothetical protein HPB48_001796 [Haemaphysalis longicornis]
MNCSREAVLDELTNFANRNPAHASLFDEFLAYVARTCDPVFSLKKLRPLLSRKLELVMGEFLESSPTDDLPAMPNVEAFKYEEMKYGTFEGINRFDVVPFTIQRLCELVVDLRKHHNCSDKFMRTMEKNVLVVNAIEPRSPGSNGDQGAGDDAVNGRFADTMAESLGRVDCEHRHGEKEGVSDHAWSVQKRGHHIR